MIACADCKHHDDSYGNNCARITKPEPVQGAVMTPCYAARDEGGECGPGARLYERAGFFARLIR